MNPAHDHEGAAARAETSSSVAVGANAPPLSVEGLMGRVMTLVASLEALAALGASLRLDLAGRSAGPPAPAVVHERLRAVAEAVAPGAAALPEEARQAALGVIRAFVMQAQDLLEQPARPPGWAWRDEGLLQSQGRASISIAAVLEQVAPQLDGLAARLEAPGAALLDVGTGTGWMAIALAQRWPRLRITGIDPWEPSLRLAHANVAASGLGDRIELLPIVMRDLDPAARFDAIWLPGPFMARDDATQALRQARQALRPGGALLFGLYRGDGSALGEALAELRAVRSGGHPWRGDELLAAIADAGFAAAREVDPTWRAPLRLFFARA